MLMRTDSTAAFADLADLNRQAAAWAESVANTARTAPPACARSAASASSACGARVVD